MYYIKYNDGIYDLKYEAWVIVSDAIQAIRNFRDGKIKPDKIIEVKRLNKYNGEIRVV